MTQKLKVFFNNNSKEYKEKYNSNKIFYNYFFNSRSDKILRYLLKKKNYKNILDIGSGNGHYYDLYKVNGVKFDNYYATDISDEMLKLSNVPSKFKYNKKIWEIKFDKQFDLIQMIGVSTYLNNKEFLKNINSISNLMKDNSIFILTLNNRYSIDLFLRNLFKFLFKKIISEKIKKRSVLFTLDKVNLQNISNLNKILNKNKIYLDHLCYHNFTYFPLNIIFPKLSVILASKLNKINILGKIISSDTILFFKKH